MTPRPIYLIDPSGTRVAKLDVTATGNHFEGTVSLESTPPELRRLFQEYEEIVEGQTFRLLDDIEGRIAATAIRAVFDNDTVADVRDLQVYPSTGAVSLKSSQAQPV